MTAESGAQSDEKTSETPIRVQYSGEPKVDVRMEAYQTGGQYEDACIEFGRALQCMTNWPILG